MMCVTTAYRLPQKLNFGGGVFMSVKQFCIDVAKITLTNLKYSGYCALGFMAMAMCPNAIMYIRSFIQSIF